MTKLKVLVTGSTGMVGSHFVEQSQHVLLTPSSKELDITDNDSVKDYLSKHNPDWIINFAAFTDVNAAEQQKGDENGSAWLINVEGVNNLLSNFYSQNFIQISTDMVFPGNINHPGPYSEDDMPPESPDNLTWYGWTKNRAENIVRQKRGVILRIIYPVRPTFSAKLDYIRGPLKRFVDGKMYPMFDDQQVSISLVSEITETINKIIDVHTSGTYHVATKTNITEINKTINRIEKNHHVYHVSSDTTSPHQVISKVLDLLGLDGDQLQKASIVEFLKSQANQSRYPVYGGLKTSITEKKLGLHFSTWQTVVEKLVAQGLKLPEVS